MKASGCLGFIIVAIVAVILSIMFPVLAPLWLILGAGITKQFWE